MPSLQPAIPFQMAPKRMGLTRAPEDLAKNVCSSIGSNNLTHPTLFTHLFISQTYTEHLLRTRRLDRLRGELSVLRLGGYYCPHFIDEEAETQRG